MSNDKSPIWETHMQTILTFIITGLIAWVGVSVSTQRTEIALLQQSMDNLEVQVSDFTNLPRFTKHDFRMEMLVYDSKIKNLEKVQGKQAGAHLRSLGRIRKIEARINIRPDMQ